MKWLDTWQMRLLTLFLLMNCTDFNPLWAWDAYHRGWNTFVHTYPGVTLMVFMITITLVAYYAASDESRAMRRVRPTSA